MKEDEAERCSQAMHKLPPFRKIERAEGIMAVHRGIKCLDYGARGWAPSRVSAASALDAAILLALEQNGNLFGG